MREGGILEKKNPLCGGKTESVGGQSVGRQEGDKSGEREGDEKEKVREVEQKVGLRCN